MNDRIFEALENIVLCQALELLIAQAENSGIDTPEHEAMVIYLRSVLAKYKQRAGAVRLRVDKFKHFKIVDNTLRKFNSN